MLIISWLDNLVLEIIAEHELPHTPEIRKLLLANFWHELTCGIAYAGRLGKLREAAIRSVTTRG